MKKLIGFSILAIALLALLGCVQTDIAIKLNPDGSGTITETVLMSKAATAQMRDTMKSIQEGSGEAAGPVELWKEEDVRAQAQDMGEGVKFESMELLDEGDYEGYRAVFSFADVNKLLINENPGSGMPREGEQTGEDAQPKKAEHIKFSFVPGDPATLTILQPELSETKPEPELKPKPKPDADTEAEGEANAGGEEEISPEMQAVQKEMMEAMLKMMLEGMKLSISVEVPGEVVSSNATHREGSRITLMEMDFDRLLQSEEHWQKFSENNPDTVEQTKELVKNVPGMKVEPEREITVRFK